MMGKPLKKPATYEEQVAKLRCRGMDIPDEAEAIEALKQLNYYRLSGYWYQFQKPNDKFRASTTFALVQSIHSFDMELRHLLMIELEKLELFFRTQLSYLFAHKHGEDGHYNQANFQVPEFHMGFITDLRAAMDKNKDAPFVAHHCVNYDNKMPLWCAVEILSFTALSKFYNNLNMEDQREFAQQMGFNAAYMHNWLHALSVLRNICAHYGRLYNRTLSPPISLGPRTLRTYPQVFTETLFAYIVVILRCQRCVENKKAISDAITHLINKYEASIELPLLGFPNDWELLLCDSKLIDL